MEKSVLPIAAEKPQAKKDGDAEILLHDASTLDQAGAKLPRGKYEYWGLSDDDRQYLKPSRFQSTEVEGEDAEVDYATLVWWKAAAIMLAETVSLGVLSLPSVFATVGMVGGTILVIGLGLLATYSGYNIGLFKMAYPGVNNMAGAFSLESAGRHTPDNVTRDAGEVMGGRVGREILGAAQIIFLIFLCASHVLTGLIAFNVISNDATCAIVWAVLTAVVCAVLTLPRTFSGIAYLSAISFVSICAACLITMIGVGVEGHTGTVQVAVHTSFQKAFLSVTNIIFAYAGHVAFLQFISEMARPRDFPKALVALQITDTTIYLVVGVVVYAYVGESATSPALGNTGFTLERVAYGIALPTIIIAGVVNGSVASKMIMHRALGPSPSHPASRHYTHNTIFGWTVWICIVASVWALAFVIAEVIPFFNDLLSVISSVFASWFTYGLSGIFYLFATPRHKWFCSKGRTALTVFNFMFIGLGVMIMGCGLYASIVGIQEGYASGGFGGPFNCAPPKSS